jgi:tetratricopeptide (TPR) repeat protein
LNFAGHGIVAVLLALLALRALRSLPAALFAGAFFALHPVHADTVSGIIHRGEILAAALALGAILVHSRSWEREGEPARRERILAAVLFALALLAKESAVGLPLALVLLDRVFGPRSLRWNVGSLVRRYSPHGLALAAVLALRFAVLGRLGIERETAYFSQAPWPVVWLTMAKFALLHYARPLLLGFPLVADFSPRSFPTASPGDVFAWFVLLAAVAIACVLGFRAIAHRDPVAGGLVAAGLLLLPVSNAVFRIGVIGAHRLLYLPSAGIALAFGALLERFARRARIRASAFGAVGLLLLAGALLSVHRDGVGRDPVVFYRDLRTKVPGNLLAAYNLGVVLLERGEAAGAEAAFRDASAIDPGDFRARYNLVGVLLETARVEEAERELADLEPGTDRERAKWHEARATLLARRGDLESAVREAEAALGLDPELTGPVFTKASALAALGRSAEAAALLRAFAARPARTASGLRARERALEALRALERPQRNPSRSNIR